MTIAEALLARVKELLEINQITAYRLFKLSGVPSSSIGDIIHMRNKTVNIKLIYEIAQGFGMDLQKFFDSPLFTDGNIID